jgi:tetratricopeptide (TPR) repeat protein
VFFCGLCFSVGCVCLWPAFVPSGVCLGPGGLWPGTLTAQSHTVIVRIAGLALTLAYATFIVWVYAAQPQTVAQVTGSMASGVGAYQVDPQASADALAFFRRDAFPEARAAFERADPAHLDARTQFYIAYSYYRQGWGRVYNDDILFRKGIETVDRAIALAPDHRLLVGDPELGMQSADELKAELERGITREASDFNPLKVFKARK